MPNWSMSQNNASHYYFDFKEQSLPFGRGKVIFARCENPCSWIGFAIGSAIWLTLALSARIAGLRMISSLFISVAAAIHGQGLAQANFMIHQGSLVLDNTPNSIFL